jgi:4-hydroxy-tetrahydrodipicolinate reductase
VTGSRQSAGPRLAVIGTGRMGRLVAQLAPERGFTVVATIGSEQNTGGRGITRDSLGGAEVAIEFTLPHAAADNARACAAAGCPVVVGTTGWDAQRADVERAVREAGGAMLTASNFSVGANVLFRLAAEAGRLVRRFGEFDAHIVETHHTAKKDAPSGTALSLEREAAGALGRRIPIASVRVGSVPGTHELIFDAPFEQLRLTHDARDRRVFAEGALAAARWLVGKRGVFTMADVLGE